MTNWKNIHLNPPTERCNICLKVGDNYETYIFGRYHNSWELSKMGRKFSREQIQPHAQYIVLDEIL